MDEAAERQRASAIAEAVTARPTRRVTRLTGGFGHDVFAVESDRGARVVVRLYRRSPERAPIEAAVMARAGAAGVPVPRVLRCDAAGALAGRPALVMEHVQGQRADLVLAHCGVDQALEVGRQLGRTLAGIHAIRFDRPGFFRGPALTPELPPELPSRASALLVQLAAGPEIPPEWRALVEASAPVLDSDTCPPALVHSDFNPKNLLLGEDRGSPVAAVLDWEFAFAFSPLTDLGNLLRFAHELPPGFVSAVAGGYRQGGGTLPEGWRELAAALDALALCDLLQRGPGAPLHAQIAALVQAQVAAGSLTLGR
jgi:aminoglycoside phosphotransferase (APT) family kinase protein